jgi:hypothetical protein
MFKKILWMQKSCNVLKYSFDYSVFTSFFLSISFVDKWSRSNVCCFTTICNMERQLCFWKPVCFFPWLAGRFHNFELTQNREKTRNGLTYKFIIMQLQLWIFLYLVPEDTCVWFLILIDPTINYISRLHPLKAA